MLPSRYFADLTQPEIAAQFKKNPLVILPCGSVEQHGPHLPTGTDTLAANVIAHAVAERMDGLVLPATPFGVTPMHTPFEGTITLTPDTYMRVQIETCVSTAKHGAKQLMIINWHEGNIPSLAIAAESLHRDHGMSVLTVQACYVAEELYGHSCGGLTHGGEIEALAVLAHRPDLVHLDRIDYSSDHALGHKMDKLRRTRSLSAGADRHPLDRADRLVRQPAARHRREGPQDADRHRRRHRQGGARNLPPARRGAGRHRARSSNCGKSAEGGLMARLLKQSEAKKLGLPGRTSLEPVSGAIGSKVTFRIAEIAVPKARRSAARPASARRLRRMHLRAQGHRHDGRRKRRNPDQAGRHRADPAEREAHDAQHRDRAAGAAVLLRGAGRHESGTTEFKSF